MKYILKTTSGRSLQESYDEKLAHMCAKTTFKPALNTDRKYIIEAVDETGKIVSHNEYDL